MRIAGLGARDGLRHARVVDRALVDEARDGVVDGVGVVTAAGEALADLRLGQLAPGEHLEAVDVGGCDGAGGSEPARHYLTLRTA